ncbi:MAG: hypothetical protein OEW35_17850 [Gammaproteobacteria bacterium]|nr:hypothetical protein [Gammaproteobacteria bacterium]
MKSRDRCVSLTRGQLPRLQARSPGQRCLVRQGRFAVILVCMAIVCGCAQTGRWTRADYALGQEFPLVGPGSIATPIQKSDLDAMSARIFLLADNQRHELLADRADWYRNAFSDKYGSPSAIRPPQLDLFGQDLLVEALAMTDGFVLHLGDACDVSNTAEFGRFAWDMRAARHGWVMAPGNHDGYLFGNSSRKADFLVRDWNNIAGSYPFDGTTIVSQAMQKDRFVGYYLAALILQDAVWSRPLAQELGPAVLQRFEQRTLRDIETSTFADYWRELERLQEEIYLAAGTHDSYQVFDLPDGVATTGAPYLRRLAWHINKDQVWQSFVLQEVDIGSPNPSPTGNHYAVSILVLDSAQYEMQPSAKYGLPTAVLHGATRGYLDFQVAGMTGGLFDTQIAAAKEFTKSMSRAQRRWLLASHHPFDELGRDAKKQFNRLRDAGGLPVTLSAHTHAGGIRWNHDGAHEGDWLEINVGSLVDPPLEFRDLQVHLAGDRHVISSRRYPLEDLLRQGGLVADELPGYRPGPEEPDFYLSYKNGLTDLASDIDFQAKRILLAAYARMFRLFETDHPEQGSTHWPIGQQGSALRSHQEVSDTVQAMLARARKDDAREMTRLLYELREYDRTRPLTDTTRAQIRAYRLAQALWAGQAEYTRPSSAAETIDADYSYFALPLAESESHAE